MTRVRRQYLFIPLAFLVIATLGACATPVTPGGVPPAGIAADGEVLGQGTVLQIGDATPQFCLGAIAASYPPQCSGPKIVGWSWGGVQGSETSGDVTWGSYAVQGTWDGSRFTVTSPPILLALYDPIRVVDPKLNPVNAGTTSEKRLLAIQQELDAEPAIGLLISGPQNGYLFVTVVYDDGDIQRYVDDKYGKNVVQIRSALRDQQQ